MSLEEYLASVSRESSNDEVEMANSLIDVLIRVCDWKGMAVISSSVQGDKTLVWIEEYRDKITSCYVNTSSLFKLINCVRSNLVDRGYRMEKYNWHGGYRSWLVEPREKKTEFYALIIDVLNAPDEIKREFEKFKEKLIKVDELPEGFKIEKGALGTFLLYKGFVCSKVFFSHSASGWFNLTYDKPQSPQEYIKEK